MFNKNDPLVASIKSIMEQNEINRQVEQKLCEELGISSRKALPHEHQANFDALLEQRLAEASKDKYMSARQAGGQWDLNKQKMKMGLQGSDVLSDYKNKTEYLKAVLSAKKKNVREESTGSTPRNAKEAELAKRHGDPNKITKGDVLKARGVVEEEQLDELSKKTLASYAIKAHRKGDMASRMSKKSNGSGYDKDMADYANKRYHGVQTAIKKLSMKEETEQLDELSSKILRKAMDRAQMRAVDARVVGKEDVFKKRYAQAKKFQKAGIEKEKEEKAAAKIAMKAAKKLKEGTSTDPDFAKPRSDDSYDKSYDEIKFKQEPKAANVPLPPKRPESLKEDEQLDEKKLTKAEMSKREELAKKMKKGDWSDRYGERGKSVMYATATKMAKKLAEENITFDSVMEEIKRKLGEKKMKEIDEQEDDTPKETPLSQRDRDVAASQVDAMHTKTPSTPEPAKPTSMPSPAAARPANVRQALDNIGGKTPMSGPNAGQVPAVMDKEKAMPANKAPENSVAAPAKIAAAANKNAADKINAQVPAPAPADNSKVQSSIEKAAPPKPAEAPKPAGAPAKQSFSQAFAAARKEAGGAGGKFTYNGKEYQTNIAGEKYRSASSLKPTGAGARVGTSGAGNTRVMGESLEQTIKNILKG